MATRWAATFLTIFLIFYIKKPFISSDSVCFDFYHGITEDTGVTYTCELLFVLQNTKFVCLLLMAGDVESCPGPVTNFSLSREEFKQEISGKGFKWDIKI